MKRKKVEKNPTPWGFFRGSPVDGIIKSKDNFATELIKKYIILVIVAGPLYRRFNGMLKYDHYSGEFNVKVRSL